MKKIQPVLVFNKADLGDFPTECLDSYRKAGIPLHIISCTDGAGFEGLTAELTGNICAFIGNSGVGKSSILNRLLGEKRQITGDVSRKLGRGRHTTRQVELIPFGNHTYIADTPGFSTLDMQAYETIYKDDLAIGFREFEPNLGNCRFSTCTHTTEPGCAVIEAVKEGRIGKSRHDSYVTIFNEIKDLKPWQNKNKKI